MAATATTRWRQLLKQLEPSFMADGFAQSPERHPSSVVQYHRSRGECLQLFDVQKDKWWSKEAGEFAINLGLFYPRLQTVMGVVPTEGIPHAGYWSINVRLGMLAAGKDKWWKLGPATKLEALADELVAVWQKFAQPWFDKHHADNLAALRDWFLKDHTYRWAAGVCLMLDDAAQARGCVAQSLLARVGVPDYELAWCISQKLLDDAAAERIKEAWHWPTRDFQTVIQNELHAD